MNIPYSWLTELLPDLPALIANDPHNLEPIFASLGTGIEGITEIPTPPEGVIFGVVTACDAIPDTHLFKLEVDVGLEQSKTIVTGAPNSRVGIGVAVAPPGCTIQGVMLTERVMQGFASWGMCCSIKELGLGEYGGGLLELPVNAAAPGTALSSIWAADSVLDVEVTPNRADALSVLGIARDLAAKLNLELKLPSRGLESAHDEQFPIAVNIYDEEITVHTEGDRVETIPCDRFIVRAASNVKVAPSPVWMQRKLFLSGMRAINNLVDISNYIMLEIGQPTAIYDRSDITSEGIQVNAISSPGRRITTLDKIVRILEPGDLVVSAVGTTDFHPLGIAGIIGAEYGAITEKTKNVVLESAHFSPIKLRLTARRLGLKTDAVYRYERGVDINIGVWAADRYMELLLEAGEDEVKVIPGHRDVGGAQVRKEISLKPAFVNKYLGTNFSNIEMKVALERLGFNILTLHNYDEKKIAEQIENADNLVERMELKLKLQDLQELEEWVVSCPSWRVNMDVQEDLVEEIARVIGYDLIPLTLPNFKINDLTRNASAPYDRTRALKEVFVGLGFQEVLAYSFTTPLEASRTRVAAPALELKNPQSAERTHLRSSLVSGLLGIAQTNRAAGNVMLLEVGRVFPSADVEEERLALLMMGDLSAKTWQAGLNGGFYAFKGLLETAAAKLGADLSVSPLETPPAFLHPGVAGTIVWNGASVGVIGALHPSVAASLELSGQMMIAELTLPLPMRSWAFSDPSRQPAALRDLAIITDKDVPYSRLEAIARDAAGEFLESVEPFDVFESERIGAGKRSVAITLQWRAQERTLGELEVAGAFEAVIAAMRGAGFEIRDS